jgi:hypothetical protein
MWKSFLMSHTGGGWLEEEIVCPKTTVSDVTEAVKLAQEADYSLVVFIGRGERMQTNLPWKETCIELSDKESLIAERQLNTGTPRLTMILDYCNNFDSKSVPTPGLDIDFIKSDASNLKSIRYSYDTMLQNAEKGFVKIQPVSSNAKTLFSQQLISAALRWAKQQNTDSTLTLNFIMTEFANGNCQNSVAYQELEFKYQGGRRLKHFPFAIAGASQESA